MNNIHEDDWGEDSWSRHSGMPREGEELEAEVIRPTEKAKAAPSEKTCPLCGKPNLCKAESIKRCWCFDTPIPPALLATIPLKQRGKSCVCLQCVERFNASIR